MRLDTPGALRRLASTAVLALVFAVAQGGPIVGEVQGRAPKPPIQRLSKGVTERELKPPNASIEKPIKATLGRPTKVPEPTLKRLTKGLAERETKTAKASTKKATKPS